MPNTPSYASSTSYAIDPAAHAVLNQMQLAYLSLKSLSEQITAEESADVPHRLVVHSSMKLFRPDEMVMVSDSPSSRSGASEVVTDGSYCYVAAPQYPSRYLKFAVPADSRAYQSALSEGILSSITLALFADPSAVRKMFPDSNMATLQLIHRAKLDGEPVDIVVLSDRNGIAITLAISLRDHLLRKITVVDPNKPGTFTESYTKVLENPAFPSSTFIYVPAPHTDAYLASSFDEDPQLGSGKQ